jgi:hypothetical protein
MGYVRWVIRERIPIALLEATSREGAVDPILIAVTLQGRHRPHNVVL